MDRLVTIKSCRYGVEIYLDPEASFEVLLEHIREKFCSSARFFEGAQVAVSFLGRRLNYTEEQAVLSLIADTTEMDVVCVIDQDREHELAYRRAVEKTLSELPVRDGQFYRGTLGKRQVIESDTSIVILGNVEPGASVIAKGNIVVVGALYGSAHAGATGNLDACIAALSMSPRSLRIGDMEIGSRERYGNGFRDQGPGIAAVDGGRIYLDPLVEQP